MPRSTTFPQSLPIPEPAGQIVSRLEDAGYEAWCVGGVIRDSLLGLPVPEGAVDIATAAPPQEVRRLFRRTVPIGMEHGTVGVLDREGKLHEITTFRRDVETDGRHAVVEFGASLDEDLARRDFTINAIAYHPTRREWRDPFNGAADLAARLIRAVGDPRQRFREDYLRILRALRFATRFGFTIEPATWDAARAESPGLEHLSAERVRDEWFKGLTGARSPSEFVGLWRDVGALEHVMFGGRCAVRGARCERLERLPRDPVLLTAYLCDDAEAVLRSLKCSSTEIERGRRIGRHRDDWPDAADAVAVRRWMAKVHPATDDLLAVAEVEGKNAVRQAVERERSAGVALLVGDLAVTGDDLLNLGIPRGPEIGRVLRDLLHHVLAKPEDNQAEILLRLAGSSPPVPFSLRERTHEHPGPSTEGRGSGGEDRQ